MNKYLITASALAMLVAGPALAADQQSPATGDTRVMERSQGDVRATEGATAGAQVQAEATRQQPGQVDAAELIGKDIENAEGDDVGEINSIILSQDGQVQAVIVGVGGFLGIGQRDVAISWDELNVSSDSETIVANMTRDQLEQLPEYEFADDQQRGTAFQSDMAARPTADDAQRERMAAAPAEPRGEMNVGAADNTRTGDAAQSGTAATTSTTAGDGATVTTTTAAGDAATTRSEAASAQPMEQVSQMSADEVIGRDVVNMRGEEVGEIEDIVLDQNDAKFAVISVGGFLGMGDKNVAVSMDELKLGENDVIMMSETTEEQLKDLPAYDETAYKPSERSGSAQQTR